MKNGVWIGVGVIVVTSLVSMAARGQTKPSVPAAPAGGVGAGFDVPSADAPNIPIPMGMTAIFDGKSLDNWVYDAKVWSIRDGALCGNGAHTMIFTKADYGSFRLLVTSRLADPATNAGSDHLGIIFWGERPAAPAAGKFYGMGASLDAQPPYGSIWDYKSNKNIPVEHVIPKNDNRLKWHDWHVSELVCDMQSGQVRMAVDGVELMKWTAAPPIVPKKGPLGMQIHGGKSFVEYKDIYIQENPPDDNLLTVSTTPATEPAVK